MNVACYEVLSLSRLGLRIQIPTKSDGVRRRRALFYVESRNETSVAGVDQARFPRSVFVTHGWNKDGIGMAEG